MKIRAEIVIELDANDFIDAAEHQRKLELLHTHIKDVYPAALLHMRERRERKTARRVLAASPIDHQTGRVSAYAE